MVHNIRVVIDTVVNEVPVVTIHDVLLVSLVQRAQRTVGSTGAASVLSVVSASNCAAARSAFFLRR